MDAMNGILTEIVDFRCSYIGPLYRALTTVDEGKPVEAGLAYLKGLPARDVALSAVRSGRDDVEQPTNDTDVTKAEDQLLAHAGLCRTDISSHPSDMLL